MEAGSHCPVSNSACPLEKECDLTLMMRVLGLLNAIDGIAGSEGRILFMTTFVVFIFLKAFSECRPDLACLVLATRKTSSIAH